MDTYNNDQGIRAVVRLGKHGDLSLRNLEREAYDAIKSGKLKVIIPMGNDLIYPVDE